MSEDFLKKINPDLVVKLNLSRYKFREKKQQIQRDVALKELELRELRALDNSLVNAELLTDQEFFEMKARIMGEAPVHRELLRKLIVEYYEMRIFLKDISKGIFNKVTLGLSCPKCKCGWFLCNECSLVIQDFNVRFGNEDFVRMQEQTAEDNDSLIL